MNNMCTLMNIFLIASMVQVGMALKRFNCDSATNKGCENMTDINLVAEDCTIDKLKELTRDSVSGNEVKLWLLRVSDIHYDQPAMTCQKIIGIDENTNERTTVRRCQLRDVNPCDFTQKQLHKNQKIENCSVCDDSDGCNSSTKNQALVTMIGVVTFIYISIHLIL